MRLRRMEMGTSIPMLRDEKELLREVQKRKMLEMLMKVKTRKKQRRLSFSF